MLADAGNDGDHVGQGAADCRGAFAIDHHNAVRLPSVAKLPDNMTATGRPAREAVKDADIVVVAIAAQFARVALAEFKGPDSRYTPSSSA